MSRSFFLRLGRRGRDWLLLARAEAIVRGYTPERHSCVRQLHSAAMNRIALADESTDVSYAAAAVTLHREAIRLLASALLVSKDLALPGPPLDLQPSLASIEELVRAGELPPLPKRYANAKAILETPDHLTFAEQDLIDAARGRAAVEALGQWLRRRIEPRSMRQIWVARILRAAVAVAALLLLIRLAARALKG